MGFFGAVMGTESGGTSEMKIVETGSGSKRARYYPPDYKGPYIVYFRAHEGKSINRLTMWNMLMKNYKSPTEVKKMFSDKVKVVFSDINEANSCVTDQDFSAFRVYIQANIVEVDGVVVMDYDENEKVLEKGVGKLEGVPDAEIKVLEVYRMKKKAIRDSIVSTLTDGGPQTHVEKKVEWIPAKAVRVTFQGSILPDFVRILGVVVQVHAFNPKVMHCEKCLRYGHTKNFCSNKPRCQKCGLVHGNDALCEESQFTCPNCKKNVPHKNHRCEARVQVVDSLVKKAQIRHNVSYASITKGTKRLREDENVYDLLSDMNTDTELDRGSDTEYPELSSTLGRSRKNKKAAKSSFERARMTQKEHQRRKVLDRTNEDLPSSSKDKIEVGDEITDKTDRGDKVKRGNLSGGDLKDVASWKSFILMLLVKIGVSEELTKLIQTWVFPFIENYIIPKVMPMISQIISKI